MTRQETIAKYGTLYRHCTWHACKSEKGCCFKGLHKGKPVCILWETDCEDLDTTKVTSKLPIETNY